MIDDINGYACGIQLMSQLRSSIEVMSINVDRPYASAQPLFVVQASVPNSGFDVETNKRHRDSMQHHAA